MANAAEQMRNTNPYGAYRGFVPQQTGSQQPAYHAVPPSTQTRNANQPVNYSYNPGQRGFSNPVIQQKPKKKKKKVVLTVFITVLALAAIGGAIYAGMTISRDMAEKQRISDKVSPYDNLYCPGVYVDGISLGGMTPEQAMNSVQSQISQRHDAWQVQLVFEGQTVANINTDLLNMNTDQAELNALMNDAWLQGHNGSQADRYTQMEMLEKNPYSVYTVRPEGDTSRIDSLLSQLKSRIDIPAEDAQVLAFDTTRVYPFVFKDEKVGRSLNTEPLKENLYQMVSTMTSGTVELIPEEVRPQTTVADLQKHFALRGSSTTPIDKHSTEERNLNIKRCFQLISGTVVQPGKNFSFNKTVGERSVMNGFYPAIEYVNDEHTIGIGGGACQASTTVYQAAVRAGMEIVSRRPHSDSVSYAEYGKDATVYMGGKQIDLVFKNTTDEPIYITADVVTDPDNLSRLMTKVCIYGADLGNVEYRLETKTIEVLPSLMEPVYVSEKENASSAKDGCIVDSYRVTYTDGMETNREFLFKDTYNPKPEKIYDPYMAK